MSPNQPMRPLSASVRGAQPVVAAALLSAIAIVATPAVAQESNSNNDDPFAGIEEMVVVGNSTAGLLDMGEGDSVLAFDSNDLEAIGAEDVGDLAAFTPNLEIRTAGNATSPTFFIRGVGLADYNSNASGSVAIYQDDVPINSPAIQLGALFDTSAVNVLRGPQGGTSSRNASGGGIKTYSRRPTFQWDAYLDGAYGSYNHREFEGALEIPIVDDHLGARFAFRVVERDGWTKNGCAGAPGEDTRPVATGAGLTGLPGEDPGRICGEKTFVGRLSEVPTGLERNVNDFGYWAARALVRYATLIDGGEMDWLLNFHGIRRDQLSGLGQTAGTDVRVPSVVDGSIDFPQLQDSLGGPGPIGGNSGSFYRDRDVVAMEQALQRQFPRDLFSAPRRGLKQRGTILPILASTLARDLDIDPYRGDYNRTGSEVLDAWGGSLKGEFVLDDGTEILTVTGFERYERNTEQDLDFSPEVVFEAIREDDAWQASQEIRITRPFGETLTIEGGGLALREELDVRIDNYRPNSVDPLGIDPPQIFRTREYGQNTWNLGAYARFEWTPRETLTLDAGVRYNFERKDFDYTFVEPIQSRTTEVSNKWDHPTYDVRLRYDPTEDIQLYMKFTRGWRSGHFNASANSLINVTAASPEAVNSWEVGTQSTLFSGLLSINAAAFYYRYEDLQIFVTNADFGSLPEQEVRNAEDAEIYGVELDVIARPVEGMRLVLNFGWLETEFLDFVNPRFVSIQESISPPVSTDARLDEDFSGNRLPNTPRFKLSLWAEYKWDLGRFGSLTPTYTSSWTDDVYFDQTEGRGFANEFGQVFLPEHAVGQRAYWVHNLRLAYRTPDDGIEIAFSVRNLANEVYKSFAFNARDYVGSFVGAPRMFYGSLRFQW